ncbi:MAG TPA: hypothetical protein VKD67_05540, partial [Acidimicrobiales bacterium]|nr:hypothetical protein [Acidimicrobiales bacterium]
MAVLFVVFAVSSSAVISPSGFEGNDGNMTCCDATPVGTSDWNTLASVIKNPDQPSGSSDNSFTQGSKEDDLNVTVAAGSIPPNKNDLTTSYLSTESIPSGPSTDTFLYLAWERAVNNGSANIDFELDQDPNAGFTGTTLGPVTIQRTEGDVLITYDFSGSGTPDIGLNFWLTAGHGHSNSDCTASGQTLPCWGNRIDESAAGDAEAAVNAGTITDTISGQTLTAGLFGETSINLSAALKSINEAGCEAFGSMFVKSRASGSSIDAELKDFIAPAPINVDTCGSIELKKAWSGPAGNTDISIGTSVGGSEKGTAPAHGTNADLGPVQVGPATYHVSETTPTSTQPGSWTPSVNCVNNKSGAGPVSPTPDTFAGGSSWSVPVSTGDEIVCTITNTFVKQNSGTTTHSSTTSATVVPGTGVTDTATVTGVSGGPAPTGDGSTTGVTFFLCQPNEVVAHACPANAGTQVGGLVALTATTPQVNPPTAAGTSGASSNTTAIGEYCWRAVYTGDSYYNGSTGTAANECFTTVKQPSTTATTSSPTGGSQVPGTPASDSATVTGTQGGPTPTGTVDFFLCQPATVTANGGDCSAGGAKVGVTKTLSGGSASSDSTTNTTTIGKYCWRAEYSGDSFYNPSTHTNSTTECFTTVKQPSATDTTSSPTGGSQVPGTPASDSATVTGIQGGPTPSGTVDFFLCQPATVTANGGDCSAGGAKVGVTKTLSGGSASSDSTTNTSTIGKYCWRAEYTGDSFYNASTHTNSTTECFTTVKQDSGTTTHSSTTSNTVVPGTTVSDTASVAGILNGPAPTGDGTTTGVRFFLCQPNEVANDSCPTGAGAQVGGLVALTATNPQVNPPTAIGTSGSSSNTTSIGEYCWRAVYTGDGFYNGSTGTAANECFTTVKQPSSTGTTSSPTGGSQVPGTAASDSATVTGIQGGPTPSGTVDFFLCQPATVTANGGDCSAGGTKVGATKTLVNGAATSDQTTSADTLAIGKYCWRAEYSGDGFYNDSKHTNSTTECFTTVKQPSSTGTTSSPTGGSQVPGTPAS